jgi:hypothetical protein
VSKVTIHKNGLAYIVDGQVSWALDVAWNQAVKLAGDGGEVAADASFTDAEFAYLVTLRQLTNRPDDEPVSWQRFHPGFPVQDAIYDSRVRPAGGGL